MSAENTRTNGHAVTHKIPVPSNYRNAAKYIRIAVGEKRCIKAMLESDKHFRTGKTIVGRILANLPQINSIMTRLDLMAKEPRLNEWMARVLIGELLFGRGELNGVSLPVECVRRHESDIWREFEETKADNSAKELFKEPRFVRINASVLNLEGAHRLMQEEGWFLVDEQPADYQAFLDRVKTLSDVEYMVDFHFNDLLVFPNSAKRFWSHAEHIRSKFFLQNKACLVPTYLLNPKKKSVVLDMCSAPGMKSTHLVNLMKNKGRLYAVERDATRYKLLCQFAADFGVIKTIHDDCLNVTAEQVPAVEYILLDPSCSGSGMLERLRTPEPVDEKRLYKLAGLQYKLLTHAMNAFPDARRIVYSTCSLHKEENEQVVQSVLRHNGHYKLVDARKELGKEWFNVGNSEEFPGIGELCLYARTEVDLTIGMFVAVFERCGVRGDGVVNDIYAAYELQKQSYNRILPQGRDFGGRRRTAPADATEDAQTGKTYKRERRLNNKLTFADTEEISETKVEEVQPNEQTGNTFKRERKLNNKITFPDTEEISETKVEEVQPNEQTENTFKRERKLNNKITFPDTEEISETKVEEVQPNEQTENTVKRKRKANNKTTSPETEEISETKVEEVQPNDGVVKKKKKSKKSLVEEENRTVEA